MSLKKTLNKSKKYFSAPLSYHFVSDLPDDLWDDKYFGMKADKASMRKKRKFNELNQNQYESEKNDHSNPSKKRRIDRDIKSSLFGNESDHNQFKQIFESIENSQIIQTLSISHDINREIAEYATGNWAICENDDCGEILSALHEDFGPYFCPGCNEIVSIYSCENQNCNGVWAYPPVNARHRLCVGCHNYICSNCEIKCDICGSKYCRVGCTGSGYYECCAQIKCLSCVLFKQKCH